MTTISTDNKPVIIINVFTVEPANQRQLLDLLTNATETSVRNAPGFISAQLHRSLDMGYGIGDRSARSTLVWLLF